MEEPILDCIADRIADLRMQKGYSARALSLELGQNPNYINLIESKKNYPSILSLYYICECLGVSLSQFFDFDNRNVVLENQLLEIFENLDEDILQCFITLAKKFKQNKK